jgi:hypothetical protein
LITPEELKAKANNKYDFVVKHWLQDESRSVFPLRIPANLSVSSSLQGDLIRQVERLRDGSKEVKGYGYSLTWEETNSRKHGLNRFPVEVWFQTQDDFLKLIQKTNEFRTLVRLVTTLRRELPGLETWIRNSWKMLMQEGDDLSHLIVLTKYMMQHPWPKCFPRELPLAIPTKLVERHEKLLGQWFDILLDHGALDHGRTRDFYARYGFRSLRPHRAMRILDPSLQIAWQIRFEEFSLPDEEIGKLPSERVTAIIVENKTNLYSLPHLRNGVGICGAGNNAEELDSIGWFHKGCLVYWGDLDVEGFLILARLRRKLPHVESLMMDLETIHEFEPLGTKGNRTTPSPPSQLTGAETDAFLYLRDRNLRIEQEHVTQPYAIARLSHICELITG